MSSLARRQVLTGLAQLPLAAVLAAPRLARAAPPCCWSTSGGA